MELGSGCFKKEILEKLTNHFSLEPVDPNYYGEVAKRYKYTDSDAEVGFITSVSETFCSTCTRARISADGKFYTCLFAGKGHDLRELLRNCKDDEKVLAKLSDIWGNRKDRYSDERAEGSASSVNKIEMSYIGG